jgi:hypothetical protein
MRKEHKMQQHLLKIKYLVLADRARKPSAEWQVYRHAAALLESTGDLAWIREELKKERSRCLLYAQRDGELPDTNDGTYGHDMRRKKDLYDEVIREVLICAYEKRIRETNFKEDLTTLFAPTLLYILERSSLAGARVKLRELALFHASRPGFDARSKKFHRKVARLCAEVLLDLGGSLHEADKQASSMHS